MGDSGVGGGVPGGLGFAPPTPVVKVAAPKGPTRVSGGVIAGNILVKTVPVYPQIAKAAHISGAVVLHAIISKSGTIDNLSVISGPEMLRASALDAVRNWKYKPYLLNGEPTEVDTQITVNFNFGGG
jgi:protein TonB